MKSNHKNLAYLMLVIFIHYVFAPSCEENEATPASVMDIDGNVYNVLRIR